MAEAIILHFRDATWSSLGPAIVECGGVVGTEGGERWWACPEDTNPMLRIFEYRDLEAEYEPAELSVLVERLRGYPAASLCFELRRSRQVEACDAAARLCVALLGRFPGIVDDTYTDDGDGLWSLEDLQGEARRAHGFFLECYGRARTLNGRRAENSST